MQHTLWDHGNGLVKNIKKQVTYQYLHASERDIRVENITTLTHQQKVILATIRKLFQLEFFGWFQHCQLTCAVADVGNTRMWVHELSLGVDICLRARWLSSGLTASSMIWMLGWSSVDMTQALTTHGTAASVSIRHVVHANRSFSLDARRLRRLKMADQPTAYSTEAIMN